MLLLEQLAFKAPFVVSLSNHERPFDRLRANDLEPIFVTITRMRHPTDVEARLPHPYG